MKRFFLTTALLIGLVSCIDQVSLPIRNETPQLVVDGLITNEKPPYNVRLSYSGSFTFDGETPRDVMVRAANVRIRDDSGHSTALRETQPGNYQTTDLSFVGQPGRTYTLEIGLNDGTRYVSQPETMQPVAPIDTIYAELNRSETDLIDTYRFFFYIDTKDPATEPNFYGWTATSYNVQGGPREYCWVKTQSPGLTILADQAIDGREIRKKLVIKSPIRSIGPHFVEVKQYSLTKEAYQFYRLFQEQQSRTGTIFDPLPASVIGNIRQENKPEQRGLGFFRASAVTVKRIKSYREDVYQPQLQQYLTTLMANGRQCCSDPCFSELKIDPPGFSE
ncbi:hypothetical protein GCM10028803_21270 [Larkinella knui]|uniref:DUF4249 domain-containing protein n=1 Tax=Larkinella knui TaxID=2025310 RepID=A0A3P1CV23_9BACT|nr:DUF4249 domain-containing protein [Larkinella knui]RRB17212.1 DUF4249 domain-containing protein [Larkinella knui]